MQDKPAICPVCKQEIPTQPGRGRPRAYHDACGDVAKFQAALFRAITEVAPSLSPQARAAIRSGVQSALNASLNPGQGSQKYRPQAQVAGFSRMGGSRKKKVT
jgi:ribosomal protein S12 methylthiotransferase accessory factor YcaO